MRTKSKKSKQAPEPRPKVPLDLGQGFWFCAFCFSVLAVCSPTPVAGAKASSEQLDPVSFMMRRLTPNSQDANVPNTPIRITKPQLDQREEPQTGTSVALNFAAQADEKLQQNSLFISKSPHTRLGRELWQARISTSKDRKHSKSKNKLQQIIEQIRSVEFQPPAKTPKPIIVVALTPEKQSNKTSPGTEIQKEPKETNIGAQPKLPYQPITDQTLQMVEDLFQHHKEIENPFELGQILFHSGHPKEAAKWYQEALDRKETGQTDQTQDKAWILFQIGNCLQDYDPSTAVQMYRQLITEYPDSPWTDLAKARSKLVNWYQQNKPETLINENKF